MKYLEGVIDMVQQLTIFDAAPAKEAFAIGEMVKIVANVEEKKVEDYYYLKLYEGSKGRIVKFLPKRQYEVLFAKSNQIRIFRHGELRGSE